MITWVRRAVNLRRGDLGRGVLLCTYLFLVISSVVIGKVARDALFRARFRAVQLPYADIASAVLVAIVIAVYVRFARCTGVRNLIVGGLVLFAGSCTVLWALAHYRLLCQVLLILIWRTRQATLDQASPTADSPRRLFDSIALVFSSQYMRAINHPDVLLRETARAATVRLATAQSAGAS